MLLNAGGNYFLSVGMRGIGATVSLSPQAFLPVFGNPWIVVGIVLLVGWLIAQLSLLSWADLTFVLPVTSISYVLAALLGAFGLGEHVSLGPLGRDPPDLHRSAGGGPHPPANRLQRKGSFRIVRWILVLVIIASNASGDLLNAFGMRRHGGVQDFRPSGIRRLIAAIARNRYVVGGVASMAVGFFALLSLLSIADLSFAIPATAGSYMIETILAKLVLKEDVHWQRWAGACLVAGGVALLSLP